MSAVRSHVWTAATLALALLSASPSDAQVTGSLTDQDRADIQALLAAYAPALLNCKAEEWAGLFATPGGNFTSAPRGEVREKGALMDMVLSYDRCRPGLPPSGEPASGAGRGGGGNRGNAGGGGGRAAQPRPAPVLEWAPEGAKGHIINSAGGGFYEDIYVKTPKGWKFKERTVISDAELAAHLTVLDFVQIRELAGDDHGHYEDLYGNYTGPFGPRVPGSGRDDRPFRSSGLKLTIAKDGTVSGLAYLRDNGGHYEDFYTKTPQGWRIKERKYFPPEKAK